MTRLAGTTVEGAHERAAAEDEAARGRRSAAIVHPVRVALHDLDAFRVRCEVVSGHRFEQGRPLALTPEERGSRWNEYQSTGP